MTFKIYDLLGRKVFEWLDEEKRSEVSTSSALTPLLYTAGHNKADTLERDFTYINLRLGPALWQGNPQFAAIARVTGSIGCSGIILGETNYSGPGLDEESVLAF